MHMLLFLVVLPVKAEYQEVKASERYRKALSDCCYAFSFWCVHVPAPGPALGVVVGWPSTRTAACSPPYSLWDRGENRKNESEKAHGSG